MKFDNAMLGLELDANLEAKVKGFIEEAEKIQEKLNELAPTETSAGSNIYVVLREEY